MGRRAAAEFDVKEERMRHPRSTSRPAPPVRGRRPDPPVRALLALALVGVSSPAPLPAQQEFEDVEIVTTHVAGSVYMLRGRGGNIGASVGEDGILLVDDQFAPLADEIRAALGEVARGEVQYVLNTHYHGDHTGGNEVFGRDAPILAHHNVRRRLATPTVRSGGDTIPPAASVALPVITFGRDVSLHVNGEEVRVIHLPHGHTDGDAVVWFTGSNVVHMGDDLFAGRFPFVDLEAGGSVQGLARNLAALLDRLPEDARVIPGHGPLTDVAGLREFHRMLRESLRIVRARMKEGKGLAAVQEEGVPAEWAGWGEGFISADRWLETVYRSVAAGLPGEGKPGDVPWHPHGHGAGEPAPRPPVSSLQRG